MTQHPYCYPGTTIYRNKFDIRDADELEEAERLFYLERFATLPRDLSISVDGYRTIHRHLLGDIYEWAGEYRQINIIRTGPFCKADFVPAELGKCFAAIQAENNLRELLAERFADRAADHLGEINAVHPFVDGNGRAMRSFLEILGEQAGHRIDLTRIVPDDWNRASALSFHRGENRLLAKIVQEAIAPTPLQREVASRPDSVGAWLQGKSQTPGTTTAPETPNLDRDDDFSL